MDNSTVRTFLGRLLVFLTVFCSGEDYIIAGDLYSQLAEFDIATNGTKYQDAFEQYFPLAQTNRANFTDPL
jgi:hypothetical protein